MNKIVSMKFKYLLIISIILISTFALGCINKIEPLSDSKVVLDQKHPSQTYIIDMSRTGNIEVSIDDIFQTDIPTFQGTNTYSWTVYGNNITKGDHEIKFRDEDTTYYRHVTNNVGNEIAVNSTNNQNVQAIDYNILLPKLINLGKIIFLVIIVIIIYHIIKKLKEKGPTFKNLVLMCPSCRNRDIYHNFKKDDLINIYKCPICGSPRIISTKLEIMDEQYNGMVKDL